MLRNRGAKDPLNIVRQLDAFPKIPEKYTETTKVGGTLSIISRAIILYLIYNEVNYYMDSRLVFKFTPDTDLHAKLKIHIDVTIAMPCKDIGADILDSTNQNVFSFGILQEEDTWFELCPKQRDNFEYIQHLNSYLREEYHSIADILYKTEQTLSYSLPPRSDTPNRPHDACRVHGTLTLNKVAGNFHITAGKSIHFSRGHIHLSNLFDDTPSNFSHRINRLSFGEHTAGIVHPLEGDEKILPDSRTIMQYFIEIVPTDVERFMSRIKTYQYSVRENMRPVDHDSGSHGLPGLYFKYDVSALKVIVKQDRDSMGQFLVRLCSIIAGIVVISGYINTIILAFINIVINFISPQTFQQQQQHLLKQSMPEHEPVPAQIKINKTNLLLSNANDVTKFPINIPVTK